MAFSAFDDRAQSPTAESLAAVLEKSFGAWQAVIAQVTANCGPVDEEWAFASAKSGWSLRLKHRKRVIVYMTPCAGHFVSSFALGEKACAAAVSAKLPADILKAIEDAPRYAEGRGVRLEVRTLKDADAIAKLAAIKHGHGRPRG